MALTPTNIGDQPATPGAVAFAYLPDQLIAGQLQLVSHNIVLMSGTLKRGSVVGRQANFSVASTHPAGTGNGTIGSITPGANVQTGGPYLLVATGATTFTVTDPEGVALPNATVGSAYTNAEINFTITAGGAAFVAGDNFTLTAQRSSGNFILSVSSASDGSQVPAAILADDADASVAPVVVGAYFMGEFNAAAVTIDTSWTLYNIAVSLQARGIHLKGAVSAATPS